MTRAKTNGSGGDGPPAVIYAAKSTKDKHLSIPEQLDDCREMAHENGWEIIGEFSDEGFTAYSGNRGPGLSRAIKLAKDTAAERGCEVSIVAQHTSRFARGDGAKPDAPRALVELFHEWARSGVRGRLVENDLASHVVVCRGCRSRGSGSQRVGAEVQERPQGVTSSRSRSWRSAGRTATVRLSPDR